MAFGLIDTSFIDWPAIVDAAYLRGLQLRSGLNLTDLATTLDAGMARVNAGVDSLSAALLAPRTTTEFARGGKTGTMKAQKASEYTLTRPQQVERSAHMLAMDELAISLGVTRDGIEEISSDDWSAQIDGVVEGLERAFRADTLYRLFSDAEIVVDPKNRTAATSPGFAGSGTGGNAFAATYPDGTALPGGYTHYYRDTTANRAAVVKSARNRLKKWAPGPYDLIGSQTSIDALAALGDFVYAGSPLIRQGDAASEALVDPVRFIGVYDKDIRVWAPLTDFTEDVYAIFKSYGALATNNPLVVRYDNLRGPNAYVDGGRTNFPLALAEAKWKYGVNVSNRVGAALITIAASGAYTPPVLTY
jgi:hypothetical protein